MALLDGMRMSKLRKQMSKDEHHVKYVSYQDSHSFLLLYNDNSIAKESTMNMIVDKLKADGKQYTIVGYMDKVPEGYKPQPNAVMFDKSAVGTMGRPNRDVLAEVLNKQYDVVIDLTLHCNFALLYVMLWSNTSMRCGVKSDYNPMLDFMIEFPESADQLNGAKFDTDDEKIMYLFDQIQFYLKAIGSPEDSGKTATK